MDLQRSIASIIEGRWGPIAMDMATRLIFNEIARKPIMGVAGGLISRYVANQDKSRGMPARITREKQLTLQAIIHRYKQGIERGTLSPHLIRTLMELFGKALTGAPESKPALRSFKEEHGTEPPWMIAISPGHSCNLRCRGCYSSSDGLPSKLPWSMVDRIITEAKRLWGVSLVVVSGGEPFAYHSEGKDLIDLTDKHSDLLFLAFTNGTLLDRTAGRRMEKECNMTVAISVEGLRETTDEIRGRGVFDRALDAMEAMQETGVPAGISVTATRDNCAEILSDEFLDFFFERMGSIYGFYFQYMPIGREGDPGRMPTPEQRLWMWRRSWEVVEKKKIFMFDFWNYGTLVHGCVSAGREKGYLHIDWEGNVTPCVFAPYSIANIQEIYARGGDLNEVLDAPFFKAIREWQRQHGYKKGSLEAGDNWLTPCPVRDRHREFKQLLELYQPQPEPGMLSGESDAEPFHNELISYGDELRELFQPVWEREYLGRV
jgi:MoaA/NifB/PqqE/SkfB family radical SAM enzyme